MLDIFDRDLFIKVINVESIVGRIVLDFRSFLFFSLFHLIII